VFSNIILADEINRYFAKNTGGAVGSDAGNLKSLTPVQRYPLERPFFILATQNPIEQAGTFPLPEAQLDRFLLYIRIGLSHRKKKKNQSWKSTTGKRNYQINKVIEGANILQAQGLVREVAHKL
jgi:MoxR-like ATPase